MRDCIEINKELVPYQFSILLADEWFDLYFDYNKTADMYTVSLYKDNEFISAEPLILGMPLFQDVYQQGLFPSIVLTPYGENERAVTKDNLGKTVFLTVDDEGDEEGTDGESI